MTSQSIRDAKYRRSQIITPPHLCAMRIKRYAMRIKSVQRLPRNHTEKACSAELPLLAIDSEADRAVASRSGGTESPRFDSVYQGPACDLVLLWRVSGCSCSNSRLFAIFTRRELRVFYMARTALFLVWRDAQGKAWVSYNSSAYLQQRHGLPQELLQNVSVVGTPAAKAAE